MMSLEQKRSSIKPPLKPIEKWDQGLDIVRKHCRALWGECERGSCVQEYV